MMEARSVSRANTETSTGIRDLPIRDKSRIRETFAKVLETIVRLLLLQIVGTLDCRL
jgi:hypothetical protein